VAEKSSTFLNLWRQGRGREGAEQTEGEAGEEDPPDSLQRHTPPPSASLAGSRREQQRCRRRRPRSRAHGVREQGRRRLTKVDGGTGLRGGDVAFTGRSSELDLLRYALLAPWLGPRSGARVFASLCGTELFCISFKKFGVYQKLNVQISGMKITCGEHLWRSLSPTC
jgi:hypothetical protein